MTHHVIIPLSVWASRCHVILWPEDMRASLQAAAFDEDDVEEMMEDTYEGATLLNTLNEPVIVIRREMGRDKLAGILAHEAFHAAQRLLGECGIKLSNKTDNESHAYLVGFLVEEAMKSLDKTGQV